MGKARIDLQMLRQCADCDETENEELLIKGAGLPSDKRVAILLNGEEIARDRVDSFGTFLVRVDLRDFRIGKKKHVLAGSFNGGWTSFLAPPYPSPLFMFGSGKDQLTGELV